MQLSEQGSTMHTARRPGAARAIDNAAISTHAAAPRGGGHAVLLGPWPADLGTTGPPAGASTWGMPRALPRVADANGAAVAAAAINNRQQQRVVVEFSCVLPWLILGGATVLLMSLASAFDLRLSESVADPRSSFGLVLERIGELPGCACAAVGGFLLLSSAALELQLREGCCRARAPGAHGIRMAWQGGELVFSLVVHVVGTVQIIRAIINVNYLEAGGIASLLVCVALTLLTLVPASAARRANLHTRLRQWRIFALCLVLQYGLAGGTVTGIKEVWGRARPKMVLGTSESSWNMDPICKEYTVLNGTANVPQPRPCSCHFTPWWSPRVGAYLFAAFLDCVCPDTRATRLRRLQGHCSGMTSFPSGHTMSAWVPLPAALLWTDLPSQVQQWHQSVTFRPNGEASRL
jgi:hypothetical protein